MVALAQQRHVDAIRKPLETVGETPLHAAQRSDQTAWYIVLGDRRTVTQMRRQDEQALDERNREHGDDHRR